MQPPVTACMNSPTDSDWTLPGSAERGLAIQDLSLLLSPPSPHNLPGARATTAAAAATAVPRFSNVAVFATIAAAFAVDDRNGY